jgi:ParB-like chromosome segregation protein Spo0J
MFNPNPIQFVQIEDLTLLISNPRTINKDQFEKLLNSLRDDPEFFNLRPCLVNKVDVVMTVYAGNQRVRAAKELGWSQVPCMIEDDLDEELMKRRIIADNLHFGNWDFDILGNEYEVELLIHYGFTENMLVGFEPITEGETEPPKKKKKKKVCPECHHEW